MSFTFTLNFKWGQKQCKITLNTFIGQQHTNCALNTHTVCVCMNMFTIHVSGRDFCDYPTAVIHRECSFVFWKTKRISTGSAVHMMELNIFNGHFSISNRQPNHTSDERILFKSVRVTHKYGMNSCEKCLNNWNFWYVIIRVFYVWHGPAAAFWSFSFGFFLFFV